MNCVSVVSECKMVSVSLVTCKHTRPILATEEIQHVLKSENVILLRVHIPSESTCLKR